MWARKSVIFQLAMNTLPRGVQRQISGLNALTSGIGAVKLPEGVQRLELRLNRYVNQSNAGAKRFWRSELPPIQFYNPQIPISVRRFEPSNARKSELIIDFRDGTTKTVSTDNKPNSQILSELVELTGAQPVTETEQVTL